MEDEQQYSHNNTTIILKYNSKEFNLNNLYLIRIQII
jgi:hypothetical protein